VRQSQSCTPKHKDAPCAATAVGIAQDRASTDISGMDGERDTLMGLGRRQWHVTANEAEAMRTRMLPHPLGHPAQRVSRVTTTDGRSPGSRVTTLHRLPERGHSVTSVVKGSPLTVAGAAAALGLPPHRVPF